MSIKFVLSRICLFSEQSITWALNSSDAIFGAFQATESLTEMTLLHWLVKVVGMYVIE